MKDEQDSATKWMRLTWSCIMRSRRCLFLTYTKERKTVAKAHKMPGPAQRSAIRPTLVMRGNRQIQVKLQTVLVNGGDNCGWKARTSGCYLSQ